MNLVIKGGDIELLGRLQPVWFIVFSSGENSLLFAQSSFLPGQESPVLPSFCFLTGENVKPQCMRLPKSIYPSFCHLNQPAAAAAAATQWNF